MIIESCSPLARTPDQPCAAVKVFQELQANTCRHIRQLCKKGTDRSFFLCSIGLEWLQHFMQQLFPYVCICMLLTVLAGWCAFSLAKKELSIQQCPTVKIQSDFCMLHVHAAVTKKKTPPPSDRRHELLRGVTAWCPWISEISRDFLRVITFVLNPPTHWGILGCIRVPNLRRPLDAFQCVQCIYMILYGWLNHQPATDLLSEGMKALQSTSCDQPLQYVLLVYPNVTG